MPHFYYLNSHRTTPTFFILTEKPCSLRKVRVLWLCQEVIDIKRAVCRHYKIGEAELQKSRRGMENEARDLAIYLLRYILVSV